MTSNIDLNTILDDLADRIAARLKSDTNMVAKAPTKAKAAAQADPDPDDDEEDTDDDAQAARRAVLQKMTVAQLRAAAKEAGFAPEDVAKATKAVIIDGLIEDEFGDEDSEDEDESDDVEDDDADDSDDDDTDDADADDDDADVAEEEEEDTYTREDLEAMSLRELRTLAKDEWEWTPADYKGMDQDALIDAMLGEGDDDADDDDEDTEEYTEDDLKEMDLAELKELAKEWGIKVAPGVKKSALVKALLAEED